MDTPTSSPRRHLSPREVARALGVSEASVKRWCDRGKLPARRTEGGHRRIELGDVLDYVRSGELPLEHPELLGLPASTERGSRRADRARAPILASLLAGDEEAFVGWAYSLYLSGLSCREVLDEAIAPVFRDIGDCWEEGSAAVYQERRATEICMRLIHQWRESVVVAPGDDSPLAIGGTLPADPYTLPTAMIDLVLREAGWRAESQGVGLPAETLASAMADQRPRLLWLSVSAFDSEAELIEESRQLYERASELGIACVVGGRGLTEDLRRELTYSAYCESLRDVVEFARALAR